MDTDATFEIGKTYYRMEYPDGYDVRQEITVVRRTKRTITVEGDYKGTYRVSAVEQFDTSTEGATIHTAFGDVYFFAEDEVTDKVRARPKIDCIWGGA